VPLEDWWQRHVSPRRVDIHRERELGLGLGTEQVIDEGSGKEANSNIVFLMVSPYPYATITIELRWTDKDFLLALAAVKDTVGNLYYPFEEPRVYWDYWNMSGTPFVRVIPSDSGTYVIAVYAMGMPLSLKPSNCDDPGTYPPPQKVAYTITVKATPYDYTLEGGYDFGDDFTQEHSGSVTVEPGYSCLEEKISYGPIESVTTVNVKKHE